MTEARGAAAAATVGTVVLGVVALTAPFEASSAVAWLLVRAGLVLALALALVGSSARPPLRDLRGRGLPVLAVLLWLALEALAALGAAAPFVAWGRVGDVALVALAYLGGRAAARRGGGHARAILALVLLAGVLPAVRATLELAGPLPGDGSGRASLPYTNANALAGVFDLTIPMALTLAFFGRGPARLAGLGLGALFVVGQGATFSRGAQVATALVTAWLACVWIASARGRRRAWRVAAAASVAVLVGGFATYMLAGSPRLRGDLVARLERTLQADPSSLLRVVVWRGTVELIRDRPLLGVGPGQFGNALVGTRPPDGQSAAERALNTSIGHAHNDVLQIAAEAGVAAAVAFSAFWLIGVVEASSGSRGRPLRRGVALGVVALLLHGLVDVNLSVVSANAILAALALGASGAAQAGDPERRLPGA